MYKIIVLFFCFWILPIQAQITDSLEKIRHDWTGHYHRLLHTIDNTVDCEANCTHPEISQIRTNTIHIITSVKSTEGHRFSPSLNIRGNIYFPKLSKKFRITFTKQSADVLTNKQIDRENEPLIPDTKLRIGLQYLFRMSENLELSTRLGIKLHNPLGIYQELTAKKRFALYQDISLLTKASLHYYVTQLYLSKSLQFSFVKPLSKNFVLAQTNDWYSNSENKHERHIVNHLKLHHHYDHHNHLVYWISYASLAHNDHHYRQDWQALSLSYIHYFTRWFYIQAIPRILQRRENHYRNEFETSLSFGMILGR